MSTRPVSGPRAPRYKVKKGNPKGTPPGTSSLNTHGEESADNDSNSIPALSYQWPPSSAVGLHLRAGREYRGSAPRVESNVCVVRDKQNSAVVGLSTVAVDDSGVQSPTCLLRSPYVYSEDVSLAGSEGSRRVSFCHSLSTRIVSELDGGGEVLTVMSGVGGGGKSTLLFGEVLHLGRETRRGKEPRLASSTQQEPQASCLLDAVIEDMLQRNKEDVDEEDVDPDGNDKKEGVFIGLLEVMEVPGHDPHSSYDTVTTDLFSRTVERTTRNPSSASASGPFLEDATDLPAVTYLHCSSLSQCRQCITEALLHSFNWETVKEDEDTVDASEEVTLRPTKAVEQPLKGHVYLVVTGFSRGLPWVWKVVDLTGPVPPSRREETASHQYYGDRTHRELQYTLSCLQDTHENAEREVENSNSVIRIIARSLQMSSTAAIGMFFLCAEGRYNQLNEEILQMAAMWMRHHNSRSSSSDRPSVHHVDRNRQNRLQDNLDAAVMVMEKFSMDGSQFLKKRRKERRKLKEMRDEVNPCPFSNGGRHPTDKDDRQQAQEKPKEMKKNSKTSEGDRHGGQGDGDRSEERGGDVWMEPFSILRSEENSHLPHQKECHTPSQRESRSLSLPVVSASHDDEDSNSKSKNSSDPEKTGDRKASPPPFLAHTGLPERTKGDLSHRHPTRSEEPLDESGVALLKEFTSVSLHKNNNDELSPAFLDHPLLREVLDDIELWKSIETQSLQELSAVIMEQTELMRRCRAAESGTEGNHTRDAEWSEAQQRILWLEEQLIRERQRPLSRMGERKELPSLYDTEAILSSRPYLFLLQRYKAKDEECEQLKSRLLQLEGHSVCHNQKRLNDPKKRESLSSLSIPNLTPIESPRETLSRPPLDGVHRPVDGESLHEAEEWNHWWQDNTNSNGNTPHHHHRPQRGSSHNSDHFNVTPHSHVPKEQVGMDPGARLALLLAEAVQTEENDGDRPMKDRGDLRRSRNSSGGGVGFKVVLRSPPPQREDSLLEEEQGSSSTPLPLAVRTPSKTAVGFPTSQNSPSTPIARFTGAVEAVQECALRVLSNQNSASRVGGTSKNHKGNTSHDSSTYSYSSEVLRQERQLYDAVSHAQQTAQEVEASVRESERREREYLCAIVSEDEGKYYKELEYR